MSWLYDDPLGAVAAFGLGWLALDGDRLAAAWRQRRRAAGRGGYLR